MLWSLLVSGYIVFLHRKLNADQHAEAAGSTSLVATSALDAEIAKLNERIESIERRLANS
jgi:hypothetical protein